MQPLSGQAMKGVVITNPRGVAHLEGLSLLEPRVDKATSTTHVVIGINSPIDDQLGEGNPNNG